ncbi:related to aquaporin [Lecanosticta acicola]|uniref:Related to aquaporin n=1 Tax=Lecanosticta acicola TaxID=111012 RepID=A0AAI8YZA3_9PEZI|nr:related to aquaporin [Lecanosticta acicola]
MPPEGHPGIVSGASTQSSDVLPDLGHVLQYLDPATSKATTTTATTNSGMAATTGFTPDRAPPPLPNDREPVDRLPLPDQPQSSDDSSTFPRAQPLRYSPQPFGHSPSQRRERKPSNASAMDGGHFPRMDFDFNDRDRDDPPPPQRNPSRQGGAMMRWGPPPTPSDYGYDDDRPYYPRPPWDYGRPVPPKDWWSEDPYYNRPYRRPSTIRESVEWRGSNHGGRGPPRPPRGGRYRGMSEEPSDDGGESDEQPLRRKPQKKAAATSAKNSSPPPEIVYRLPFTTWMNRSAKGHFVALIGEFMGTTMFLFFAFAGTQVANVGAGNKANQSTTNASTGFSPIVLLYISLSFGFSLMINVWIFFRISGGLFNPAVTLSMVMVKAISVVRGLLLIGAQLVGAVFSSYVVSVLFPTTFNVRTTLSKDTSVARGVFIEAVLTGELVFTIYMLANEKHKATFMAPIGVGLALFVAEMVGVYYTGGSLNPARSFGPCVVSGVWDPEHWIYFLAWAFYRFIKILEYEMANPGQESSSEEEAAAEAADVTPKKAEKASSEDIV